MQLSVEEAMLTIRNDDARVRIRTAVDAEGRLLAREAMIHLNTGAYAENSPLVAKKAANRIIGPYRIPNVSVDCLAVYSNTVPASSFRGFGATQVTFPGESQMDELAEKLRSNPVEFRPTWILSPSQVRRSRYCIRIDEVGPQGLSIW